ncbi:MAG: hypothetical protein QOI26_2294 [Pseudonocardiales bacterium]|jgi:hypothetical protein|nr:hypothetical protein [Pseudonocardiales bacterium]
MTDVPADGTAVVLRDQQGRAYRSEVARSQPGVLFLQPPPDLPAIGAFALGTRLLVTWPDETSLRVLPVMLLSVSTSGEVGLLAVQVQGVGWREERRRYARTNIDARLTIGYDNGGQGVEASGELIDLSEAALRGVVAPEHQALCRPRTPVQARIELASDSFEIGGYVLLGKPTARLDFGLEVVVLFHRPVARVEDLRRHLGELVKGS